MRRIAFVVLLATCAACGASELDLKGTWNTVLLSTRGSAAPIGWVFAEKSLTLLQYRNELPPYEEQMPYTLDDSVVPARLFITVSSDEDSLGTLLGSGTGIVTLHEELLVLKLAAKTGMLPRITSPDVDGFTIEPGFVTWWLEKSGSTSAR